MSTKKSAKKTIERRIPGLVIQSPLTPRPNLGNDLASDIFSAIKEQESNKTEAIKEEEPVKLIPKEKPKVQVSKKTSVTKPNLLKIEDVSEKAKAHELYEKLYSLTLGAEEPMNSVRLTRNGLMNLTSIKTKITLDLNLKRLSDSGLVKIESRPGEQKGNIYYVFQN